MKKLYAGLAAAALTATGIACTAGAAHADLTVSGSSLDYVPGGYGTVSTAVGTDGTVYTAAMNVDQNGLNVSATTASGTSTRAIAMGDAGGVTTFVVTSTGKVVFSGWQGDGVEGLWTAPVSSGDATDTYPDVAADGDIAASPDGLHVAVSDGAGAVTVVNLTDGSITTRASLGDADAAPSDIEGIAVDNSGNAYVVGDDSASVPTLWTVAAGATSALPNPEKLSSEPNSVALAGSKILVGEITETSDDETYSLEVFDGDSHSSVALSTYADFLAVSPGGDTAFVAGGDFGERIDLSNLAADSVADDYLTNGVVGLAASATSLYVVASPQDDDYNRTNASLLAVTKPGDVTNTTQSFYRDGSIDVEWKAPADNGGGDLTYVVTATNNADDTDVVTHAVSDPSDYIDADSLKAGATYGITVRAENVAFAGDDVTVAPVVPGSAKVTVSGGAVVGGTLTATVSNNTFPAGTKLSYQWGYSCGQCGSEIDGATKATYSPTADMAGMQVSVSVTATLDGYNAAQVYSNAVRVAAAPTASTPAPVHVTKIKNATIKASAKKVKLKLPGINVAKAPGKVKVYDGKKLIGKAKIVNGKLVLKLKKHLHHGKHKLKLTYKGSAKVAKFKEKVKLRVK